MPIDGIRRGDEFAMNEFTMNEFASRLRVSKCLHLRLVFAFLRDK